MKVSAVRLHDHNSHHSREDFMRVYSKNSTLMLAIALGLLIAAGCSGHSSRHGANSEGDGLITSEAGNASGGIGGYVDGTNPYLSSSRVNPEETASASNSAPSNNETMGGMDGTSLPGGTDYEHNYSGVDGSGPQHGPVSGFGNGLASSSNPDPETWANTYLGNGHSSREFYGELSKSGTAYSGPSNEGVNPATWADNYTKENGGPSPEYINPDMNIAHANGRQAGGSVGIGSINENESTHQSSFDHAIGTRQSRMQDIYFAFDSWHISRDAAKFLEEGAQWLQANPGKVLTIEGHTDQRGTQDYNLVLGQKRAEAAREYLVNLGVQPERIKIVSYGKERPFCQNDGEDCFQENRRNHMVVRVN
jgi:peptidoglycan-associated lipoprotein